MNPLISIIIPVHNESKNIPLARQAIEDVFKGLQYAYEIIFIDDGSSDDSADVIERLARQHTQLRLVELARNFGKEIALTAGIHESRGDAVIMMDADLQHPPHLIPDFIKKWEDGADVVIGVRKSSGHKSAVKGLGTKTFYKIMSSISETEIIPHATDFRLVDRQVAEAFKKFTERKRITRGLFDWLGFKRDVLYYEPAERQHGEATYSLRKLIGLAINSLIGHSIVPLRVAGVVGVLIIALSVPLGIFIFIEKYVIGPYYESIFSGSAILAVLSLFLSGVTLASLGLIALYIEGIHHEVTNRPLYVTRRRHRIRTEKS